MAVESFNKFNVLAHELGEEVHNFGSDTLKFALTNTAPSATDLNFNLTNHPAPAAANGYTAGGNTIAGVTWTQSTDDAVLAFSTDCVFTATGGQLGPFRYVVAYNSSSTGTTNAAIGYWSNTAGSITLEDTETFTITAGTIVTVAQP